jgi:hypothetical protein
VCNLGRVETVAARRTCMPGMHACSRGIPSVLCHIHSQVVPSLALNFTIYEGARSALADARLAAAQNAGGRLQPPGSSGKAAGDRAWWWSLVPLQHARWEWVEEDCAAAGLLGDEEAGACTGCGATVRSSCSCGSAMQAVARPESIDHRASSSTMLATSATAVDTLACGCAAGAVTSTATYPLDVVRRRMQLAGRLHPGQPVSYAAVVRQLAATQGLRGFYSGILAGTRLECSSLWAQLYTAMGVSRGCHKQVAVSPKRDV